MAYFKLRGDGSINPAYIHVLRGNTMPNNKTNTPTPTPAAPAAPVSGAPDSLAEVPRAVVWNERNELVDPALDEHFKAEHHRVLGNDPATGKPAVDEDGAVVPVIRTDAPPNTPQVSQRRESQTADPFSNPQPNADPNNRPSPLGMAAVSTDGAVVPVEVPEGGKTQAELDQEVIDEAKSELAEGEVDRSVTIEGQGGATPPVIGTEAGNVRGNPAGAEGGVTPLANPPANPANPPSPNPAVKPE